MEKILVTGGAGFIGSEFVRQGIERGYKIILIDKLTYAGDMARIKTIEKKITFYKIDIANKKVLESIFKKEKPDIVVHWAAESHVDRSLLEATPFLETNIMGTYVLLDLLRQYKVYRFINISTDEVYGELKHEGQFFETTAFNPSSPYSVSKSSSDMLGRAYYRTYGVPVITIRPSNNYGQWQHPEKFIPVIIMNAINNKKIPVYGDGKNMREWLYVSDCVDAVFKVLEKGRIGEIYNVGSGEERKNLDVVRITLNLLGKSNDLIEFVDDRLGHDFRYSVNSDKIKKQIGWKAKTSFFDGIEETIEWYVKNVKWARKKMRIGWGK